MLGSDLQPTARSSTQIDAAPGIFEDVVFAVELCELEGSSGTVALFLGKPVEFIQTAVKRGDRDRVSAETQPVTRSLRDSPLGRLLLPLLWHPDSLQVKMNTSEAVGVGYRPKFCLK